MHPSSVRQRLPASTLHLLILAPLQSSLSQSNFPPYLPTTQAPIPPTLPIHANISRGTKHQPKKFPILIHQTTPDQLQLPGKALSRWGIYTHTESRCAPASGARSALFCAARRRRHAHAEDRYSVGGGGWGRPRRRCSLSLSRSQAAAASRRPRLDAPSRAASSLRIHP